MNKPLKARIKHDPAPRVAVDDPPIERREQKAGQHGAEADAGRILARVEALLDAEDHIEQRELVEPVAEAADDLAPPQSREVRLPKDGQERGRTAR
jgi:hypothetical protein